MALTIKKNILVPTDFSEYSTHALRTALEIARTQDGRVYLLHIVEAGRPWRKGGNGKARVPGDYRTASPLTMAEKQILEAGKLEPVEIVVDVRTGIPQKEILRYQKEKEIDLIIIGSRSTKRRSIFQQGRLVRKVVKEAASSVLVVGD
jgi:nucleotide-binding universal stress UspA family protein